MKPMTAYVFVLGLLLIVGGVTLGLMSVSINGHAGSADCGRPWGGTTGLIPSDFSGVYGQQDPSPTNYVTECADKRDSRGFDAVVVVLVGGCVAAGAVVARTQTVLNQRSESQAS
jgi:hypothetical protein